MPEITRSVKVALKCLIVVVLVDVDLPYWTSNGELLVAFVAAVSNICTARAQKRFLCTSGVDLDTAYRFADPDFPLKCKTWAIWQRFTLIFEFNILNVCRISTSGLFDLLTYKVYHTRRAEVKFEVYMTIHCRVIAFLSADTSRDFVTLTFDLLTLNSCTAWRVTWPTLLPSLKILHLSVLDLWVITFPLVTIENPYAANAHAPNHVTRE